MEYVHPVLNEEVNAIGGFYVITKKDTLPHPQGEILYLVGHAVTDTSCCGLGGCGYAVVPGHIISFHAGSTEDERVISLVEPVETTLFSEIASEIARKEGVTQVHFLLSSGEKRVLYAEP
ncbi:MAG TPA: hypothetical protein ENN34_03205 [Deltaproteobacteria bacterium]|nr:hypothetical protein [Deltaproteobacteria bacterium]